MDIIIEAVVTFLMVTGAMLYYFTSVQPDLESQRQLASVRARRKLWYEQIFSGEDEFINFEKDWDIKPEDLFLDDTVFRVDLSVYPEDITNTFSYDQGELRLEFSLKTRVRVWDKHISKINTTAPFQEERYLMPCIVTFKSYDESNVCMNYYPREEVKRKNKDADPPWAFQLSSPVITVALPLEAIKRIFDQVIQCRGLQVPLELRLQTRTTDGQMKSDKYRKWFELKVTGVDVGSRFR